MSPRRLSRTRGGGDYRTTPPSPPRDEQFVSFMIAGTLSMLMAEKGGTAFAPSQFVFDLGTAVKLEVVTAYRPRQEWPHLDFHLRENGSDDNEKLFGNIRLAQRGAPNVDCR
ncbi:uncharacterized protein JCM15063_002893 [Sporobolomyces koalae]|uniref:uncharacterized protein n=1 Tax=Sporobolomyces koalae TaxID=500713 RepID=UPI00316BEFB4